MVKETEDAAAKEAAAKRADLNKSVEEQQELLDTLKQMKHIGLDNVCLKCQAPILVRSAEQP